MSGATQTTDTRRTEILNLAVSTDTILYAPFLLAYHGGDFENAPFCKLSVNIIGKEDRRFEQNEKLKGDGFATFCLLFDLADTAICDPSYLVYLKEANNVTLQTEFKLFETLLKLQTKEKLQKKYPNILKLDNNRLSILSYDKFKELFIEKNVIGGLISKMAFSVVASPDLKKVIQSYEDEPEIFGYEHAKLSKQKTFVKKEVIAAKGKLIYYKTPSTGYILGKIHAEKYGKISINSIVDDFGYELKLLQNTNTKKSLAITCDFVTLDFLLNKDNENDESRNVGITQIQDLALDKKNYLFTGIIGNIHTHNDEKLKAFLYGIDKNLYTISKFLIDDDTTGLTKYFRNKFKYTENKQLELLDLLVADQDCRKKIDNLINDKEKPDFTFDTIIRYYIDRLYEWNKSGGLYYDSTYQIEKGKIKIKEDLKNMLELRYEATDGVFKEPDIIKNIDDVVHEDLLKNWRNTEKEFWFYENSAYDLKLKEEKKDFYKLLIVPVLLIWGKSTLLKKLWIYVSKPTYLYLVGSIFLMFEIVTSMLHIVGFHCSIHGTIEMFKDNLVPLWYHRLSFISFCLDIFIFGYIAISIIALIYQTRKLIDLKEKDKYFYRNE